MGWILLGIPHPPYFSEIGGLLTLITLHRAKGPQFLPWNSELGLKWVWRAQDLSFCLYDVQIISTWRPVEKYQTLQRECPQALLGPAHTWRPGYACMRKGHAIWALRPHTRAHTHAQVVNAWSLRLSVGRLNQLCSPSSPVALRKALSLSLSHTHVYTCSHTSLPPWACPAQGKPPGWSQLGEVPS